MGLSDFWIFSDVDGTIVEAPAPIPERNLTALKRFTQEGGHFALATGRSIKAASQYISLLPVNAPCIIFNGGGIYDFSTQKFLDVRHLPDTWRTYVKILWDRFSTSGITLLNETSYLSITDSPYTYEYLVAVDGAIPTDGRFQDFTGSCIKVIFVMPEDEILVMEQFVKEQDWKDVCFLRSSPYFLEMLPLNVHKGSGLLRYQQLKNIPLEHIVAIGDYYNDEPMLKVAGYPVTVANAPDPVKALCKYVTGPCMGGALADLVAHLETLE